MLPLRAATPGLFLESQPSQPRGHPESTQSHPSNCGKQRSPQMVRARAKITAQPLSDGRKSPAARSGTHAQREWLEDSRTPPNPPHTQKNHKHLQLASRYKEGETLEGYTSVEKHFKLAGPVISPSFPGQPWPSRVRIWGKGSPACHGHSFDRLGPFSLFCFLFLP